MMTDGEVVGCIQCATQRGQGCPAINDALKSLTENINSLTDALKQHDAQAKSEFSALKERVDGLAECVEVNKDSIVNMEGIMAKLGQNTLEQAESLTLLAKETGKFAKTVNDNNIQAIAFYQKELSAWRKSDKSKEEVEAQCKKAEIEAKAKVKLKEIALYSTITGGFLALAYLVIQGIFGG